VTVHGASIGKMAYMGRNREDQVGCEATGRDSQTSIGFTHIDRDTKRQTGSQTH